MLLFTNTINIVCFLWALKRWHTLVVKRRTAFCRFCRFFCDVGSSNTYSACVLYVIFCERTTEANSGGERLNILLPPFIFGVCERGFLPVFVKGKSLLYPSKLNDASTLSFNMARNMPCKHQIQGVRMFHIQIRKQCDFAKITKIEFLCFNVGCPASELLFCLHQWWRIARNYLRNKTII